MLISNRCATISLKYFTIFNFAFRVIVKKIVLPINCSLTRCVWQSLITNPRFFRHESLTKVPVVNRVISYGNRIAPNHKGAPVIIKSEAETEKVRA